MRRWLKVGMKTWWTAAFVLGVGGVAAVSVLSAAEPSGSAVLDTKSFWRCRMYWCTQQVKLASGEVKYGRFSDKKKFMEEAQVDRSSPPPEGWMAADFDDSAWGRERGPFGELRMRGDGHLSQTLAMICLRGSFDVPHPAGDMKLDMAVSGGVVVYVNGKEITRVGMPAGKVTADTPADAYPNEAWLDPDGKMLTRSFDEAKHGDIFKKRLRNLSAVIPASALKKGRNVLAVEIHRAPVNEIQFMVPSKGGWAFAEWYPIGFDGLNLSGGGAASAAVRPAGVQVWTASLLQKIRAEDWGEAEMAVRPIVIAGARNGAFSGQVVVSSSGALSGVKGQMSELAGEKGGVIPASAVQVRYALPDGPDGEGFFDGLLETPPAEAPKGKNGSVQPVWVTVNVPKDARPGNYTGKLTLSGPKSIEVPVHLSVADWAVPDTKEFASFLDLVQSPETLAEAYKTPMWSERHWKAIDRSFEMMGLLGCKAVYVSLVRQTDFGNKHGMVRWIKKGDGWVPDLSIAEKYIAMAVKRLGKVPVVVLNVWHSETGGVYMDGSSVDVKNTGFPFTQVDPATGNLTEVIGPAWSDPKVVDFLRPAVDGIREILKKHGIEKSMMVGVCTDMRPRKDAVDALKQVAPDARWAVACHPFTTKVGDVDVGFLAHVWGISCTPNPYKKPEHGDSRVYGWKNPNMYTAFPRYGCSIVGNSLHLNTPLATYRVVMEAALTSPGKVANFPGGPLRGLGLRGVGRLGADFWHVMGGKTDSNAAYHKLYGKKGDHAVNLQWSAYYILSRGPEGAISSARFEAMREGIEESEARIFIEKAISGGNLDAATAKKFQDVLDERAMAIVWGRDGSSWSETGWQWYSASAQDRAARLFAAAAAVNKVTGGK